MARIAQPSLRFPGTAGLIGKVDPTVLEGCKLGVKRNTKGNP